MYKRQVGERVSRVYRAPGKPGDILKKNEKDVKMHGQYRSILGKIMFYVQKIAPECCFACGQLARHMHNPGEQHWEAMGRFVGYLKGKEKHELVINRPVSLRTYSFGDGSYGDCPETRTSSTGDVHTIGGAVVSWRAQKTNTVCLSTAEVEYIEMTEMAKEQRFIEMAMEEMFECVMPGVLYEDNEAAIYLAKNQHVTPRTKHIDIRMHYIREHVKNNWGTIVKIRSEDNFADVLTKNVSVKIFEKLGKGMINGFQGWDKLFEYEDKK